MRLWILALVLVVVVAASGAVVILLRVRETNRAWGEILVYEGKPLCHAPREELEKVTDLLDRCKPAASGRRWPTNELAGVVWLRSGIAEERVILFEYHEPGRITSPSSWTAHVFLPNGHALAESTFEEEPNILVDAFHRPTKSDVPDSWIQIDYWSPKNKPEIARKFYALSGDNLKLVRSEDSSGRVIQDQNR